MKVQELRELLENYEDNDVVLIAHQPSWPLQEVLQSVVSTEEIEVEEEEVEGIDANEDEEDEELPRYVYLVAGGHPYDTSPYAPRGVFA